MLEVSDEVSSSCSFVSLSCKAVLGWEKASFVPHLTVRFSPAAAPAPRSGGVNGGGVRG